MIFFTHIVSQKIRAIEIGVLLGRKGVQPLGQGTL